MKRNVLILLTALLLTGFPSCVERQDFDQYDALAVTPTVEASLLYIEAPERVINQISGTDFVQQIFNFDAFAEDFVSENLLDGVVRYQVENTTSKPLELTFELLDEGGNTLDTEAFSIDAAPTPLLVREIAYGPGGRSIDIIRNTSSIRVTARNLGDNTSTSSLPNPMVILRSSAQFRIRLK